MKKLIFSLITAMALAPFTACVEEQPTEDESSDLAELEEGKSDASSASIERRIKRVARAYLTEVDVTVLEKNGRRIERAEVPATVRAALLPQLQTQGGADHAIRVSWYTVHASTRTARVIGYVAVYSFADAGADYLFTAAAASTITGKVVLADNTSL